MNDYPKTVSEVLDDNIKYKNSVIEAVLAFKKKRPWKGSIAVMERKFRSFNKALAEIYEIETPQIVFVKKFVYGSCYFPIGNVIILERETDGRYSVVTYLHEFGHALGKNEKQTCKWSINLFRKCFPKAYEKLIPCGHLLKRGGENE